MMGEDLKKDDRITGPQGEKKEATYKIRTQKKDLET